MTYELRTYTVADGRLEDLLDRFRNHTDELFLRHSMRSIGYWVDRNDSPSLVYLLHHTGDPKQNWDAFKADPDWIDARDKSQQAGPLATEIRSRFLDTTDFSPKPGLSE